MRAEFENFHRANPHIYVEFAVLAVQMLDAGQTRISARAIFHILRNRHGKLNDHYSPFYARLFLSENHQHHGVFELRFSLADAGGYDLSQDYYRNLLTQE